VAITGSVLRKFYKLAVSSFDKLLCQLFIGAFCFAMRSCEYVKVQGPQKTKLLTVRNIRFYNGNRLVKHSDPNLSLAECLSITFEFQKRDSPNYSVNLFRFSDGKKYLFTGTELLKRLSLAATVIGEDILGFSAKEIGLHSARSGAMAMYLAHAPVFTIMLLGRWSIDAFLRYIQKQVKEFRKGISSKMLQQEHFFTVPSSSSEDPRTSNHPLNLAVRNKNDLCSFKGTVQPLASVFH
jgi:hypothetical protein